MDNHEYSDVSDEADMATPMKTYHQNRGIIRARAVRSIPASGLQLQSAPFRTQDYGLPSAGANDEEYDMGHRERGTALIFSHKNFDVRRHPDGEYQPPPREGTEIDKDILRHTFMALGFQVLCFDDWCYEEISRGLRQLAEQDHGNRNCLAVVVLSHCGSDGKLYARDRKYHVRELWEPFTPRNCPSLEGKPKLFFIQASGARGVDLGVNVSNIFGDSADEGRDSYADILVSFSAFDGVTSAPETQIASRFVQTLHDQLAAHGRSKDLVSLLTDVNRIVAQQVRLRTDRGHRMHQPCFTSTLMRRVRFQ